MPSFFSTWSIRLAAAACFLTGISFASPPPNIVFILCDDLGYGDVRCLNPGGKIATPQADRLAAQGMMFTDAHSSSAVCTPTRYSLLTGRYNWRSRLQSGVQGGISPPLIAAGRLTVGGFLQQQGYTTACIGKWHLGMDWPRRESAPKPNDAIEDGSAGWLVDYSKPIANGPVTRGFDSFFGISASLDMIPYTFIEDDHVTQTPAVDMSLPMTAGRRKGQTRKGPGAEGFTAERVLPALTEKAVEYIKNHSAAAKAGKPFFLYLPLASPHTPIAPSPAWVGKSGISPYADFVMETDASLGTVLSAIDEGGVRDNTLVIFTSDNGCSPQADYAELATHGHHPSAAYRGTKADIFEGGHRVPFIARWPGRIRPGSRCEDLICLMDFFATCAEITGGPLPATAAEDSVSFLPALEGRKDGPRRESLVHHSINGSFAIRQGQWKLSVCSGSGGWSDPKPGSAQAKSLPPVQLYDFSQDPEEKHNLAAEHPETVAALTAALEKIISGGRSTPGPPQQNDVPVTMRKE